MNTSVIEKAEGVKWIAMGGGVKVIDRKGSPLMRGVVVRFEEAYDAVDVTIRSSNPVGIFWFRLTPSEKTGKYECMTRGWAKYKALTLVAE